MQLSYKLIGGVNVLPGMVAVGKFDGKNPALAVGKLGNRVAVYSPHTHTDDNKVELRYLNVNCELKALHDASLTASRSSDMQLGAQGCASGGCKVATDEPVLTSLAEGK
jgi:hypothetical protein